MSVVNEAIAKIKIVVDAIPAEHRPEFDLVFDQYVFDLLRIEEAFEDDEFDDDEFDDEDEFDDFADSGPEFDDELDDED